MAAPSSPQELLPAVSGSASLAAVESESSLPTRFGNWLKTKPDTLILLLVILIGSGTGSAVVLFHYLIEWIQHLTLENFMGLIFPWGAWTLALVPTLGGVVVGLMRWGFRDFGPGLSALVGTQRFAPLPVIQPISKALAAAVSLGTGASLGPEGPSVEMGANIGLLLAQMLQVSRERRQLLLGAGAAAGLAAGFNAPIAGVFLSLELVLSSTFATTTVGVVLLAAVVAALITQVGLGGQPAFTLPVYEARSPWELPLYLGLGVLASGVSLVFTAAIKGAQKIFQSAVPGFSGLQRIPAPWHPILGGLCVGLTALVMPQILGIGYETIEALLQNVQFSLPLLLMLLVVKLGATAISLGSGLVGGIFAPAMFLGAALGATYGKVLALVLPAWMPIAAPPAYAMVGMAAVLAGSARSPLTAILLLFELTRDYRIILPLMAAVGISVLFVEWFQPKARSGLNLQQMGMNLEQDQSQQILKSIPVTAVMRPQPLMLPEALTLTAAATELLRNGLHSSLVVNPTGQLVGICTLQDLNRAIAQTQLHSEVEAAKRYTIADVCTKNLVCAYSHESLADAMGRMKGRGLRQLPVVEAGASNAVLGLLEVEAIIAACEAALTQQLLDAQPSSSQQHRAQASFGMDSPAGEVASKN
jgi:H+/Cl- antiporter ClcA/CBS domain-containing protein